MRLFACAVAITVVCSAAAHTAAAQESSVSGAVGGGVVGDRAAGLVEIGVDVSGDAYALGLGGRLRFVDDSIRREDWDERSELAGLLRYLTYTRPDTDGLRAAFVAGELGDATLGYGGVVDGYASGLDMDHGHLGAQLRVAGNHRSAEALIDDVVRPRIVGARGEMRAALGLRVGGSATVDVSAPTMAGTEVLPLVTGFAGRDVLGGRVHLYGQAVAASTVAAGVHVGAVVDVPVKRAAMRIRLRGEARAGTSGYVPGWIGPLYELERATLLDRARRGGMAGLSGMAELRIEVAELGRFEVAHRQRRHLPDVTSTRLMLPHYRGLQGGVAVVAEDRDMDGRRRFVLSTELRARLPGRLFVAAEASHLYRDAAVMAEPVWVASAALGGVLGSD